MIHAEGLTRIRIQKHFNIPRSRRVVTQLLPPMKNELISHQGFVKIGRLQKPVGIRRHPQKRHVPILILLIPNLELKLLLRPSLAARSPDIHTRPADELRRVRNRGAPTCPGLKNSGADRLSRIVDSGIIIAGKIVALAVEQHDGEIGIKRRQRSIQFQKDTGFQRTDLGGPQKECGPNTSRLSHIHRGTIGQPIRMSGN